MSALFQDNFDSGYTIIDSHANPSGLAAEAVAKGWTELSASSPSYHEISTTRAHSGTKSLKYYIQNDGNLVYCTKELASTTASLYLSYWIYFPVGFDWSFVGGGAGEGAAEMKFGRFMKNSWSGDNTLSLISQHIWPAGALGLPPSVPFMEFAAPHIDDWDHIWYTPSLDLSDYEGQWTHFEYYFVSNTSGNADGTLMFWVDGTQQTLKTANGATMSDNAFKFTTTGIPFRCLWTVNNINGYPDPPAELWQDDVYISTTNDHTEDEEEEPPALLRHFDDLFWDFFE